MIAKPVYVYAMCVNTTVPVRLHCTYDMTEGKTHIVVDLNKNSVVFSLCAEMTVCATHCTSNPHLWSMST